MQLTVNQTAIERSSMGVRRYYREVMRHLAWPHTVAKTPMGRWRKLDRLGELLQRGDASSILWSPAQRGPLFAHNHVVTVHDCISIEYTYRNDWRRPAFRLLSAAILKNAERIIAISHATKAAILRNFPLPEERIVVIQSGSAEVGTAPEAPLEQEAEPFVLMVTNALPHKNGPRACLGFAASRALREGIALRVVGSLSEEAMAVCRRTGIRLQLHRHVSDEQLWAWYRRSQFLLSPSLEEGHNLPVSEALSVGANVLCADIPVHREFYDRQALFFDPLRPESLAAAIDDGLFRSGKWFSDTRTDHQRTFSDVANDYRAIFHSIARGQPGDIR